VPVIFRRGLGKCQPRCRSDFDKDIVAFVSLEEIRSDITANDEQIDIAIIIVIARSYTAGNKWNIEFVAGFL